MRRLVLVLGVLGLLAAAGQPARAEVEAKAINAAIERGVAALLAAQKASGAILLEGAETDSPNSIGSTALGGLTLVECGEAKDSRAVQAAAAFVRKGSLELKSTYSLALSILFLDRLGEASDTPLIESMIVRLVAGQKRTGMWGYDCPG